MQKPCIVLISRSGSPMERRRRGKPRSWPNLGESFLRNPKSEFLLWFPVDRIQRWCGGRTLVTHFFSNGCTPLPTTASVPSRALAAAPTSAPALPTAPASAPAAETIPERACAPATAPASARVHTAVPQPAQAPTMYSSLAPAATAPAPAQELAKRQCTPIKTKCQARASIHCLHQQQNLH